MQSIWIVKRIWDKKPIQISKKGSRKTITNAKPLFFFRTIKAQIPIATSILFSELFIRPASDGSSFFLILLLGVVMYTALYAGQKQGLISALLVVAYTYYIVILDTDGPWFSLETLQRGAVIAIAFPALAFVIGRLKERNDTLLLREQNARQEAEASEKRLRFMAEAMPQKIFTMKPNGDPDYSNPQWEEYIGNPSEPGVIKKWSEIVHPDDVKENAELWQHSLETGEPFQFEHRLMRQDGKYIWHITRAHALYSENGTISAWIGSTTDIEDVRRTRRLEASTARLVKQRIQLMELNAAKDEFISLASHQLRTPATGVKQYINMVLDGFAGTISPELRVYLEKANDSNERQLSVINDLLKVAQIDSGKVILHKEDVDANKLIASIIHEQSSKFSARNQTLKFKKIEGKLSIAVDATKIRMVIENVIDNASKYTPEGKNITIQLTRSQGMARISVKDEGVGIAEEDIEKIFQKFQRLQNPMSTEVGGTGLGLYWVKKVVELHDGTVLVSSKINKGSTFTISLPLS